MQNEDYNIRYYVKSLENPMFKDITAWHIFDFCLLMAFPKGSFTCGREQMQKWTGIKGTTARKALLRLENAKMVTVKVTGGLHHRHSIISIVNWPKYQPQLYKGSDSMSDNPVTTQSQPSDNPVTHYDKEIGNKNKELIPSSTYSEQDLEWLKLWENVFSYPITQYVEKSLDAVNTLVSIHGEDMVKESLFVVRHSLTNKYIPKELKRIKNYETVMWNWDAIQNYKLSVYMKEKTNKIMEATK